MRIIVKTIISGEATVNIHDDCCGEAAKAEKTISRVVSESYRRRSSEAGGKSTESRPQIGAANQ